MNSIHWASAAAALGILSAVSACLDPGPGPGGVADASDVAADSAPDGDATSSLQDLPSLPDAAPDSEVPDAIADEAAPEPEVSPDTGTSPDSVTCEPDCEGKACGDDGCGGLCGSCLPGEFCSSDATCEIGECVPDCSGKTCGSDGCQGICGLCAVEATCQQGACTAIPADCPVPVITVQEGAQVLPQTLLHLDGTSSYGTNGINQYQWSVVQAPSGSESVFLPSAAHPSPAFEVNIAGTYILGLSVRDGAHPQPHDCPDAQVIVNVVPVEEIHVELLWRTPGDPDETDTGPEAGADLDLHFTHPWANGTTDYDGNGLNEPWFHSFYDCFWFNGNPNWGNFDPFVDDDPGLDRDDTDGAGPENMNLAIPEEGSVYRVGVHYWNDHGFGPSYASVRIFLSGKLAAKYEHVLLDDADFWEVATIEWPSGVITPMGPLNQQPYIMKKYPNPLFPDQ